MPHILKNENLKVTIDLPNEGYKAARFDYTGKITSVRFQGVPITTTEQLNAATEDYSGKGFYNEFGIDSALDYNEIKAGEWFHKIGIGLLRKDDDKYQFNKNYEIRPANFTTQIASNSIFITCESESTNGYAYVLKKEIVLHDSSFTIHYFLENTGVKSIETTEYNHNFITINNEFIGGNYSVNFPFEIQPKLFDEYVNPENCVEFRENLMAFNKNPNEQFFFSKMNTENSVLAHWELKNRKQNIGISETGNFNTKKVNLWGWKHVISPELFYDISLSSNESTEWNRKYAFFNIQ